MPGLLATTVACQRVNRTKDPNYLAASFDAFSDSRTRISGENGLFNPTFTKTACRISFRARRKGRQSPLPPPFFDHETLCFETKKPAGDSASLSRKTQTIRINDEFVTKNLWGPAKKKNTGSLPPFYPPGKRASFLLPHFLFFGRRKPNAGAQKESRNTHLFPGSRKRGRFHFLNFRGRNRHRRPSEGRKTSLPPHILFFP